MFNYFYGIWLALCGKFPHEEVAHLLYLKENLTRDYNWFQGIPPGAAICQRHHEMASFNYKANAQPHIKLFRYEWFQRHPVNDRRKDTRYSNAMTASTTEDDFKVIP